jgi:glutamate dehydrogenase (NADP+)
MSEAQSAGSAYAADVIAQTIARNPAEPEFHQAVQEVLVSLAPVLDRRPEYRSARILERSSNPNASSCFASGGRTTRVRFKSIAATAFR